MEGGRDLSELEPWDPEEFDPDNPESMMGSHVGHFVGLNILNAQPGFTYAWWGSGKEIQAKLKGYEVVTQDSPERAAYQKLADHDHVDLDSTQAGYPGLVLVRRRIDKERQFREAEQEEHRRLMRGGASENAYLNGGSAAEARYNQPGRPTRFMRDDHQTVITEGYGEDAAAVESWSPSQGISR